MLESYCALEHVDCSLMLPTVIESLDVGDQVLNFTAGKGERLVGPVECRIVQLLGGVLLHKTSGFCKHV